MDYLKRFAKHSDGRRHSTSSVAIALTFAVFMAGHGTVKAHPDGEIGCRAQVVFEDGSARQIKGELMLDEHHSLQALGQIRKPGETQVGAAALQRLRAVLNQQFGRFNWLFGLKGDGEPQGLAVNETPDVEIVQNRLVLKVHYTVSSPKPAKLWSLRCSDPTYYWSTRFETHTELAQTPSFDPSFRTEPAQGHRNIVVRARTDDPAALRLDGCPGRRAALPVDSRDQARKGIAQLDWNCAP